MSKRQATRNYAGRGVEISEYKYKKVKGSTVDKPGAILDFSERRKRSNYRSIQVHRKA